MSNTMDEDSNFFDQLADVVDLNEVQLSELNSPEVFATVEPTVESVDSRDQRYPSLSGEMKCPQENYLLDEMLEPGELPNETGHTLDEMTFMFPDSSGLVELKDQVCSRECVGIRAPNITHSHGTSSIYTEGPAQVLINTSQDLGRNEAGQSQGHTSTEGHSQLHRCMLVQKFLTASDVGTVIPGILLPKEKVVANFPDVGDTGLKIRMHDGEGNGKTWSMSLMKINSKGGSQVYRLKQSWRYMRHHALRENDLLQIIREEPHAGEESGRRYILKFKRCLHEYKPVFSGAHTAGRTWRMIFQKILIASDAGVGPQSAGSIVLGKKEVVQHFPSVPPRGKEGIDMILHDWHEERIWITKLKRSVHKVCDVYRLQNIAQFLRFNAVEEGDIFSILKSDAPDVRYAVWVSKPLAEERYDQVV